jgi:hypothetical protein
LARIGVQNAAVLDVALGSDHHGLAVAAHHHAKPQAGFGANRDVAHHHRARRHKGGGMNLFGMSQGVNDHAARFYYRFPQV